MEYLESLVAKMQRYSVLLGEKILEKNCNLLDSELLLMSEKIDKIHNEILAIKANERIKCSPERNENYGN